MKLTKKKLSPRKEPNQERAKETVETIFQATTRILEQEGFEKTSTNKIAVKAGISIGSLYQYFPTKDSIVSKMFEYFMKRQIQILEDELKKDQPRNLKEVIESIVDALIESKKKEARLTKIFAQKLFSLGKHDTMQELDTLFMNFIKEKMEVYKDEIRMENIDLSLFMIYHSLRIIPIAILFDEKQSIQDKKIKEEMVHLCYQYLKK